MFQVGFNSNPNQAIFNPDLVRVGSGLVHNIEIFCSFTCLCGWYSLFPIKYRSTDKHLDENHHCICWKTDLKRSWSMLVKGKSPTMIQWYPIIWPMNTLEREWVRLERERERERERNKWTTKRDREGRSERERVGWEREETSLSEGKKNDGGVTVLKVLGIKLSFRDLIG